MTSGPRPDGGNAREGRAGAPASPELDADTVAAWLRRHPDFLIEHPELLSVLLPPDRGDGDGVVDLQRVMVDRQRQEIAKLKGACHELLSVSRANASTQGTVHACLLMALAARSFEHLIEVVTHEFAPRLRVDVVTLCIEGEAHPRQAMNPGVHVLPPGTVDRMLGSGSDARLLADLPKGDDVVFGPAAGLIRSQALARLDIAPGAPSGLLAVGSREAQFFHPKQGAELLTFLARGLGLAIRGWLDLPRPQE